VLTGHHRWALHEPAECEWLSDSDWSRANDAASRAAERRVLLIGSDIGGDRLALKLAKGSDSELAAAVYAFNHDSGKLRRIASSLVQLFTRRKRPPTLEQQATAMLREAERQAREKRKAERAQRAEAKKRG
jgi:hypothetical protein